VLLIIRKPLEGQLREVAIVLAGRGIHEPTSRDQQGGSIGSNEFRARLQLDYPQRRSRELPVTVFQLVLF
jgi:hypothetical protein